MMGARVGIVFAVICAFSTGSWADQEGESGEQERAEDVESDKRRESGLFGSRASIAVQLEDDDAIEIPAGRLSVLDGSLTGISAWKKRLLDDYGLQLGMDFATLAQSASETMTGIDDAWGGVGRLYGRWELHNRGEKNAGLLSFKVEHRSALGGKIPPKRLGGQIGYSAFTDIVFGDDGNLLTELSYQQRLGKNDQVGVVVGRFDPNNYMDVLGCCSPWTTFSNLSHLLNLSIALPDASWGVGAGSWLGEDEQWYVSGSINDANGNFTTGLDWFTGGAEFFKQVEVGWSPARERRLYSKVSLALWHVDAREDAGLPSAQGFAFSANKTWNDTWMGFFKAGASSGKATLYSDFAMMGFGRVFHSNTDRIGLAVSYANPLDSSLRVEQTMELFYKFQLAKSLQLTTSYQFIKDPALNPDESSIHVFGLRLRFVL